MKCETLQGSLYEVLSTLAKGQYYLEGPKQKIVFVDSIVRIRSGITGRILTVAKSFWLNPLDWRPCWISFPTSNEILPCLNSSVSRSNFAVFLVATCCLLVPAPSTKEIQRLKKVQLVAWLLYYCAMSRLILTFLFSRYSHSGSASSIDCTFSL